MSTNKEFQEFQEFQVCLFFNEFVLLRIKSRVG